MPVHPRKLPDIQTELAASDWQSVQDAFQASVGVDPSTVIPQNATIKDGCYALLFHAYKLHKLDDFLNELRHRIGALGVRIDHIVNVQSGCPTQAIAAGQLPLMDRQSLRQTLPSLVDTFHILMIEGSTATGKSYSAHLIGLVGRGLAAADVIVVRVAELLEDKLINDQAFDLEPFELVEYIADPLGLQLRPELRTGKAQDSRIVQKLLNWFAAQFSQRRNPATPVWLIIDDLNFAGCPPWVHDLALSLAERCTSQQLEDLRLILIGMSQEKLVGDSWLLATQDVHNPITKDDVWDFIVKAAAARNKPVDPTDRPQALARVWGDYRVPLKHEQARRVSREAALLVKGL